MKAKKNKSLINKLVLYYSISIGCVLLIIFILLYFVIVNSNRKEIQLTNQILVNQTISQLDSFITQMDNIAYKVMTNDKIIQRQIERQSDKNLENYYDENILDYIDTVSILSGANDKVNPVWRISIYNNYGDFISSGAIVDKEIVKERLKEIDVGNLMDFFRHGDRDYLIYQPQKDTWSNYFNKKYFSFIRPIMNEYSREVVGIVEIQQEEKVLLDYISISPNKELYFDIFNEQGITVLSQSNKEFNLLAESKSNLYGWEIKLSEPKEISQLRELNLFLFLIVVCLVITFVVSIMIFLITRKTTKPLMELTKAVKNINVFNSSKIQTNSKKTEEVADLELAFNQMLDNLMFSHEQEKKSFLLAMQNQMNPHFLYNILSVINAAALDEKTDTVMQICENLSSMLRYSSSYSESHASIEEELKHTVAYLELMKNRYEDMFTYVIDVDKELYIEQLPKLTIQPICENCFIHGFSNIEPPYIINIQIKRSESGWFIKITDNGSGFDEKQKDKVLLAANNYTYEDISKLKIGGLGLISSVVRLKLFTNRKVKCQIDSGKNINTSVDIIIS